MVRVRVRVRFRVRVKVRLGLGLGLGLGYLVLHVPLGRGGRRVATADDALASVRLELGHSLEHGLVRVRG